MTADTPFAATLLEHSASAYAAEAAAIVAEPSGEAFQAWQQHLTQRVFELAAAVAHAEPALFVARVRWSRKAFQARGRDTGLLVQSLEALGEVLDRQLPPAAGHMPQDTVAAALEVLRTPDEGPADAGLDPAREEDRLALTFLNLVLEGHVAEALSRITQAATTLPVERLYLEVLIPAQREIGSLWQLGDLSIPEEHLVTTTTERAMAILAHRAPRAPANGRTVLIAGVAGNAHALALRAAADLFELAGWRALLLGTDVPAEELPAAIAFFGADLLVLSAVLSTQLRQVEDSIAAVRRQCGPEVRILVGGGAFDEVPGLWRRLGADGYAATLGDATRVGGELVGLGLP